MIRTACAAAAVAVVIATGALAAQKPHFVFVENSQSGDVSIIDGTTLKVTGTIAVGASPDDIVAAPDGKVLYLSRIVRGDNGRLTGGGEVVAIDPVSHDILWRAPFRGSPNHVAVSPDGRLVYVTVVSGTFVDIIDAAKHALVDSVNVGTGPHDIDFSHDGKTVYVGLIRGTDVVAFDAATHKVLRKIATGANVRPIAVNDNESRIYIQLSHVHGFLVADPKSGAILQRIAMPVPAGKTLPDPLPVDVNHGLRITANGKQLIANGSIVDETAIYSLPDLKLVATVPVGRDPNWVTLSPDGTRCYISNRGSDDVSVIDMATHKEIARIKVGKYPQRMTAVGAGGR